MTTIYMIRHGQASVLSDNYDQLSDLGKKQAQLLGEYFVEQNIQLDKIIRGPLYRHEQSTQHFIEAYQKTKIEIPPIEIREAFREHQGPKMVRELAPSLLQEEEYLKEIHAKAAVTRQEAIRKYLRTYEYITRLWARGELDERTAHIQSWKTFNEIVVDGIQELEKEKRKTIAIIASGGNVAALMAYVLELSPEKAMEVSWIMDNSSVTKVYLSSKRKSVHYFNCTSHLQDATMITTI